MSHWAATRTRHPIVRARVAYVVGLVLVACHSFDEFAEPSASGGSAGASAESGGARARGAANGMDGGAGGRAAGGDPGVVFGAAGGSEGLGGFMASSDGRGATPGVPRAHGGDAGAGNEHESDGESGSAGAEGASRENAAGGEGQSGSSGSAGQGASSTSGDAGRPSFCREEQTGIPSCVADLKDGVFPPVALTHPRSIAVATTELYTGFHVISAQAASDPLTIAWGTEVDLAAWQCFDVVPHATRVAATSLLNEAPEFFAATGCGALFARREFLGTNLTAWSQWTPVSLPEPDSLITDVAVSLSQEGLTHLYVADRGRVFVRRRMEMLTYAAYGEWRELGAPGSQLIAAGLRPDGRQQLFVLNGEGRPSTCLQSVATLDADFGDCVDFGDPALPVLVDIDVPYRTYEELLVFAIAEDHTIWLREISSDGSLGSWQPFRPEENPVPFVSMSAAALRAPGAPLWLFAVGKDQNIYARERRDGTWESWRLVRQDTWP